MYGIASMIWLKLANTKLLRLNLNVTAEYLGIQLEPTQHRALNGAVVAYKVLKNLRNVRKLT